MNAPEIKKLTKHAKILHSHNVRLYKTEKDSISKAPYVWSRVPEPTLPPSYPKRANFSLISLQSSADSLHEVVNSSREGETTRRGGGGGECVRMLRQGCLQLFFPCRPPFCRICNLAERGLADVKFHINAP